LVVAVVLSKLRICACRILIEDHPASRTQLNSIALKTVNDAADDRDLVPAQPKSVARAGYPLFLGATIFRSILRM